MPSVRRFEVTLQKQETSAMMELPFDVRAEFGRARPPVRVVVNGFEFKYTVATYGGRYYIGLNKKVREAAGVGPGDRVQVELSPDDEPREVDVPPELASALVSEPDARSAFESLSYTHRKEYATWIAEAKKEDTRARRAAKAIAMLKEGVRHP